MTYPFYNVYIISKYAVSAKCIQLFFKEKLIYKKGINNHDWESYTAEMAYFHLERQ